MAQDDSPRLARKAGLYESRREREFYRYYEPIRALTASGPPACNLHNADAVKNHQPCSSPDRALTAFCQLSALRLGTRRAMLFFFDSANAYVLAEATRTLSLQDDSVHDIEDSLWLGHTIIPRGFSICEETVCRLPATEGPLAGEDNYSLVHIINDLEQDTTYCDRPYVTDGPRARFYAGVPITTPKGINIGAFCVLDDVKRDGLDDKGITFLRDMASATMTHLEMVRAKAENLRGTRGIKALGAFIEGASSLGRGRKESHHRHSRKKEKSEFHGRSRTPPTQSPGTHNPASAQSSRASSEDSSPRTRTSKDSTEPMLTSRRPPRHGGTSPPPKAANGTLPHSAKTSGNAEDLQEKLVTSNVRTAFERAAELVREAIDVDGGVVFLDATVGTYGGLVDMLDSSDGSTDALNSGTESEGHRGAKGRDTPDKICKVLASSHTPQDIYQTTNEMQRSADATNVTEGFLQALLKRYPAGKTWSFNNHGDASSDEGSSEGSVPRDGRARSTKLPGEAHDKSGFRGTRMKRNRIDDGREIQRLFPGVRSLALVGMWDQSRGRWSSACAVWTYSPLRLFSIESEITYLTAFMDVIMAEVHRIEARDSDTAKSDFISSVSHELRSPLHGILGSVEALQDEKSLDHFSAGLVSQIEICGRTLLDIVDHLLDFSKINPSAEKELLTPEGAKSHRSKSLNAGRLSQLGMLSMEADVALDIVTEEVVESAVYSFCCSRDKQVILDRKVAVILDIDRSLDIDWRCRLPLGGWKRICINLVSNALKYTSEGYIHISLRGEPIPGKRKRFNTIFTVADSGRGMSKEFLQNHLFVPFNQEDSLMEGTGLGMCLVAKIIKAIGGKIEVRSERSVGTTMIVTVPVEHRHLSTDDSAPATAPSEGSVGILGFRDTDEAPTADAHQKARTLVSSSVRRSCEQLNLQTSLVDWTLEPRSDVYLVAENDYVEHQKTLRSNPTSKASETRLIVLCDSAVSARRLKGGFSAAEWATSGVEFIAQPCGPERLLKAVKCCMDNAAQLKPVETTSQARTGAHIPTLPLHNEARPAPVSGQDNSTVRTAGQIDDLANGDEEAHTLDVLPLKLARLPTLSERLAEPIPPPLEVQEDYLSSRSKSTGGTPLSPFPVEVVSPKQPSTRQSNTDTSSTGLSMLLVDDNQINLQLLVNYAKKQGHRKLTARDGIEAVEAYKAACLIDGPLEQHEKHTVDTSRQSNEKPHVILMDINMPRMDGFEATRRIRAFEKQHGLQPAHIVALTGLGSASAQQEAFSSGVDLFLSKPVRLKDLTKLLDEMREVRPGKTGIRE